VSPRRQSPLERLPQAIAEQVVKRIVEVVDVNEIVRRIDVDDVVRRIDVNAVVERVDPNALMDRVDIERVVERVDVNAIADRIDVNAIAARLDIDAIADRIDLDELVRRADLGPIIAQSTSGMLGEFLGLLRRQVVSLDELLDRVTLRDRRVAGKPSGPPTIDQASPKRGPQGREGQYAGGVSRLVALAMDVGAGWGLFLLLALGIQAAVRLFVGSSYTILSHRPVGIIAIVAWGFLYFSAQWALSGRTIGMAIVGARVTTIEGRSISRRAAIVRSLVLPISIAFWFVALVGIELRADRRALHDLCAGTCVVYHWHARGASLPWLQRDD
jgi:uncharacterized RDD family membrane protein YckC